MEVSGIGYPGERGKQVRTNGKKPRLYPTTKSGQPLLTNWLNNQRLTDFKEDDS